MNELEIVRKNIIPEANEFKVSYQPRHNFVKGDLLVDSHSILSSWKNYLSVIG